MGALINSLTPLMSPAPVTELEKEFHSSMSELEFSVFVHKMTMVALEGKEVLAKTGASLPLQSEDSNTGIYTSSGDMATSAPGVYYHALTGQLPVKWTLMTWGENESVGVHPGDIFYSTDALYGATHTPDQICFMPVFVDGELVAWTSATAHQSEVGAVSPGMPPHAVDRWQDGLRLSPIKIGERGMLRDDMLHAFSMMTRAPHELILDIKARVAACVRMATRVEEVVRREGHGRFAGAMRRAIDDVAEQSRRKLSRYKDGTYRHTMFLDHTGGEASLVRLTCEMRKEGDHLTVDLTGCSPQVPHAFNGYANMPIGAFANPLFSYLFSDVPASVGVLDVVDFVIPDGSVISADENAAVNAALWPTFILQDCMHVCLMKMAFASRDQDKIAAAQNCTTSGGFAIGVNQYGNVFADLFTDPVNGSGAGGRIDKDGVDVFTGVWGNYMDTNDSEQAETRGPYLKVYSAISRDLHGFGTYRGGASTDVAYIAHEPPGMLLLNPIGFGSKLPVAPSLFGGYYGSVYPGILIADTNIKELMAKGEFDYTSTADVLCAVLDGRIEGTLTMGPSQSPAMPVADGDLWCFLGAGSGGYGDPLERELAAVGKDVVEGVVSQAKAVQIYGAVYDELLGDIDVEKSEQKRAEVRAQRRRQGKPYTEFVTEWEKKRPVEQALSHYGTWPIPVLS